MVREKVSHENYFKIAKENEYFLWHFLQKEQNKNTLALSSIIDEGNDYNTLSLVLDNVDIPYFESYTEDSIDFLMGLGFKYENLYVNSDINRNFRFGSLIVGFKKFTKISSTFEYCYCADGVISVLNDLDSKFIEQLNNNIK